MPGRVTRSSESRPTGGSRPTARITKPSPNTPTATAPDEGEDSRLRGQICQIFTDAQKSTVQHRKQVIALRRVQEACCYEPTATKQDSRRKEEFDEDDFNREISRCLLRILTVRKSESVGDRVIRFLGTYLNSSSAKDLEVVEASPENNEMPETPTSKLATQILRMIIPFLDVKDKTVRFRATQVVSHIINSMDTLDDQMFYTLRVALLKRIHDKEAPVRLQAVYGLGRLAAEIEDDEDDDESDSGSESDQRKGVLGKLLNILQHDPSAEVRRNLLLNLPLTKDVLPFLLERARDEDATTRRALYARLLPALGDFRHLSLTHREKLLRWGLRDRDETVRTATAKLFRERWIEDCAALPTANKAVEGGDRHANGSAAAAPSLEALLELLERIDVVNSGSEGGIALVAMQDFWEGRPDYVEYISFPDQLWNELSPELSFVARTYNKFCRQSKHTKLREGLEEKLPEVTKFAFLLQRELRRLVELITAEATDDELEEESAQCEFVVEQMLNMTLTFDYGDEVGRQKMFALMREALATPDLPEETTRLVVETLRLVCGDDSKGEKEFCGIVLEAIAEVHDTIMGDDNLDQTNSSVDESFHSAASQVGRPIGGKKSEVQAASNKDSQVTGDNSTDEEKAIREIVINMKCLHIALCMLQNVQCNLEDNIHLVTMLNNLIVPAVRSQEAPIRERGLCCLGLCCLLGKTLATENLTLFLHCFNKGNASLQATALQIISDIITTHPSLLSSNESQDDGAAEVNDIHKQILKAFSKALKSSDVGVQSTGAVSLSKAMLSRTVNDPDILKQLIVTYFDPDTVANVQLRQSLAYFLPVYCQSNGENARRVAEMAPTIMIKLATLRDAYLEDADVGSGNEGTTTSRINLTTIGQMLLDWTDPRKSILSINNAETTDTNKHVNDLHFLLAQSIFEQLYTGQVSKDIKKLFISMLGKLCLPLTGCEQSRLELLLQYVAEASDYKLAQDATSRNVLTKLQAQLLKCVHDTMTIEREEESVEVTAIESTEVSSQPQLLSNASGDPLNDQDSNVTLDTTTLITPDAEGTRVVLDGNPETGVEDEDMMDTTM